MTESQSKKFAADHSDKILQKMTELFQSVQMLGWKMECQDFGTPMKEGFESEGIQRKKSMKVWRRK